MTARRAPVVLSPADLHAAWLQRRRSDWPATFDAAMAHPLLGRLVRAEAIGLALAARRLEPRQTVQPTRPLPLRHSTPPIFDRKRAASGEREDD